jgi:hypothetical protein
MRGPGGGGTAARARGYDTRLLWARRRRPGVAHTPRKAAAHNRGGRHGLWLTDGPSRASGWAGAGWVGPTGSAQLDRNAFFFFRNIFLCKDKSINI